MTDDDQTRRMQLEIAHAKKKNKEIQLQIAKLFRQMKTGQEIINAYEVDAEVLEIEERIVILKPQQSKLYNFLAVNHYGELKTVAQIAEALELDGVSDPKHAVVQAVSRLRIALRDAGVNTKVIQTVGGPRWRWRTPVVVRQANC